MAHFFKRHQFGKKAIAALFFSFLVSVQTVLAQWSLMPGKATHLGAGADGSVFAIGLNKTKDPTKNAPVFKWTGNDWQDISSGGGGIKVAGDVDGTPWIINEKNEIWKKGGAGWTKMPGAAIDLAIGKNGAIWCIGTEKKKGEGGDVFKWENNDWRKFDKQGLAIAVDPSGMPWIADKDTKIWKMDASSLWTNLPGGATDIAVGADGSAWCIGKDKLRIYKWSGTDWAESDGGGVVITVDAKGAPYIVNKKNEIWKKAMDYVKLEDLDNVKDTKELANKKVILKNVNFEYAKATLTPQSKENLGEVLDFMKKATNVKLFVSGHTDNVGVRANNIKLSKERARSVVDYLVSQGIERTRLSYDGFGPDKPIDDNDVESGRANNRRVEFEIR